MAADKAGTRAPHSLSALMHAHEQLLKTDIDTAGEEDFEILLKNFWYCKARGPRTTNRGKALRGTGTSRYESR